MFSVALAQTGGDPSSPGALGILARPEQPTRGQSGPSLTGLWYHSKASRDTPLQPQVLHAHPP